MMEGETIMSEADPPRQATSGDIPESWGFHLLQELRRMEDKMDAKFDAVDAKITALESKMDTKIDALESKMDAKFDAVDAKITALESKMDTKIDVLESKMDAKIDAVESRTHAQINDLAQEVRALRYWSWGAILTVIAGAIATILTVLFH